MYLHDELRSTEACVAVKGVSPNKLVIFTLESHPSNKRSPLKKPKHSTALDDENPANEEKPQNHKPEASSDAVPEKTTKSSVQNSKFDPVDVKKSSPESTLQSPPTKQPDEEAMDVVSTGPITAFENDVTLKKTHSKALIPTGADAATDSAQPTADTTSYKLPPNTKSSIAPEASIEDTVTVALVSETTHSQLNRQDGCSDGSSCSSSCSHSEALISSNLQNPQERCGPIRMVRGKEGNAELEEQTENQSDSEDSDEFYEAREYFSDDDN